MLLTMKRASIGLSSWLSCAREWLLRRSLKLSSRLMKVLSARESKSRSDAGIVEFEHSATNQRGELVAECKRQALMRKRPKG